MSGHLRGLCESPGHFAPLEQLVAACRASAIRCDLFVHTWDELYAQTATWHTWYPAADVPKIADRSHDCLEHVRKRLQPAAVAVDHQPLPSPQLRNETWSVAVGRHRETHVSLVGLRNAIRGVDAVAKLRQAHEQAAGLVYDVALRLRPDLYHRRNFRRSTRSNYRGVPINQICSVPEPAWKAITSIRKLQEHCRGECVYGCDDETAPGNKSGDMCFWSSPPSAIDRLVAAWDGLADEYLEANVCWQHWRARRSVGKVAQGRVGRAARNLRETMRAEMSDACPHPETQYEGSAAELILKAAASREGISRVPLHGDRTVPASAFVSRSAKCT